MSRAASRRLLAQSPLIIRPELSPVIRLPVQCSRPFSNTSRWRTEDPFPLLRPRARTPTPSAPPPSPSLNPKASSHSQMGNLAATFGSMMNINKQARVTTRGRMNIDIKTISSDGTSDGNLIQQYKEISHQLYIYATRHNVHITLTRPPGYINPKTGRVSKDRTVEMSFAAGNIGFRKSARKHYDSAFQLASYVMSRMQEQGINPKVRELEVFLRGFGAGREAVTKALLGTEGRYLRGKIVKVSDATRLKFGGTRSKKPRRLG